MGTKENRAGGTARHGTGIHTAKPKKNGKKTKSPVCSMLE